MKKLITVNGYILDTKSKGENGLLALILTNSGFIYGISSSGNKISKKSFPLSANIGSLLNFELNEISDNLFRIKNCNPIYFFGNYSKDIKISSFLLLINEMSEKFYLNNQIGEIFNIYGKTIDLIKNDFPIEYILFYYLKEVMKDLGNFPNVKSCVSCGETKNIVYFSFEKGGFVCKNCFNSIQDQKTDNKKLILYKYLFGDKYDFESSLKLNKNELLKIEKEIILFLSNYYSIKILSAELLFNVIK